MPSLALMLYGWLTWALQPLLKWRIARRAQREALYGQWIDERFGCYTQQASQGWIWIHAVSLGETRAAEILLAQLRSLMPDMRLLLTHGTATGRAEGARLLRTQDIQVWQPWDTQQATQRFFSHFKPRLGIVMETEVWPMLCASARAAHVPMVLANARLNPQSEKKALRLSLLSRPAYRSFHCVYAQTPADAQRLTRVGAEQTQVLGNLKFDAQVDLALIQRGKSWKASHPSRAIVLLASSREGEEALLLQQIMVLRGATGLADSHIQWLIVPRHPQRFEDVALLCHRAGLSVSRRSQWQAKPLPADIWLGDSMGEMTAYYALADLALLGGSFEPLGGQNLIEAIAAQCPVIMGPHTFNFAQACDFAEQFGAAQRVGNMQEAVSCALTMANAPGHLNEMQAHGERWLSQSRGSAKKMAQRLHALLIN
jgi:3-deoxy-D-manno-octulosonic-acid transferase